MEKFTLSSTIKVLKDGQTEVCLRPTNEEIDDYLATYKTYLNKDEALLDLNAFIAEMTPLLYDEFENMQDIPIEIRNKFEL